MNLPSRSVLFPARVLATALLLPTILQLGGCNFIHNYGSGAHLDPAQPPPPKHHLTAKAASMLIDVSTNSDGQVVAVEFIRSSGSNAVDNFVADSIRRDFPGSPSTRTRVEVDYKPESGFGQPKLISTAPLT